MTLLNQLSGQWQAWIVAASWQMAVLACLVAALTLAARGASPRLRHGLWLLVLVKVFLPTTLEMPWSAGHWLIAPLLGVLESTQAGGLARWLVAPAAETGLAQLAGTIAPSAITESAMAPQSLLMITWAAGGLIFWAAVGWRYARLVRIIRSSPEIDEGPVRVALEQIGIDLALPRVPELYSTSLITSPFLFGIRRPAIVLPEKSLAELSQVELRAVLIHELVHFKRLDTWIGWLQVLAQGLFWFHPFVWLANSQLRHERECACDDAVLRLSHIGPQEYGESIFRVLTASRGRSLVAGSLVGVFERGVKLQDRLENIMNYEPRRREFGWGSRLTLAAAAVLLLPMSPGKAGSAVAADSSQPQVVKTVPQAGATGVDPGLKEITVTFDRDMAKGMSWTGGPPEFPPIDESRKAAWRDGRTCVLPVKLQPGTFYRLGINSLNHQNFKSAGGVAAPPATIYFTTKGATAEVEAQSRVPEVVSLEPKNGATDVDPKTDALKVTFNMPMGEGMSWTGGGPSFPKIPEGKKPSWSKDGLTCTLPVALEPGRDYQLGLNSASHKNFQSKAGVPLSPVVYKFRTSGAK